MGRKKEEKRKRDLKLKQDIQCFKKWAVGIIYVGVVFGLAGWYVVYHTALNKSSNVPLHELGGYFAGTVGVLWGLSGILFIYVAFLGQQLELNLQRKDLKLARKQMELANMQAEEQSNALKSQVRAMESQRIAMEKQARAFKQQQIEVGFFNLKKELMEEMDRSVFYDKQDKSGNSDKRGKSSYSRLKMALTSAVRYTNTLNKIYGEFRNVNIKSLIEISMLILNYIQISEIENRPLYYNILYTSFSTDQIFVIKELINLEEFGYSKEFQEKFISRMNNRFAEGDF